MPSGMFTLKSTKEIASFSSSFKVEEKDAKESRRNKALKEKGFNQKKKKKKASKKGIKHGKNAENKIKGTTEVATLEVAPPSGLQIFTATPMRIAVTGANFISFILIIISLVRSFKKKDKMDVRGRSRKGFIPMNPSQFPPSNGTPQFYPPSFNSQYSNFSQDPNPNPTWKQGNFPSESGFSQSENNFRFAGNSRNTFNLPQFPNSPNPDTYPTNTRYSRRSNGGSETPNDSEPVLFPNLRKVISGNSEEFRRTGRGFGASDNSRQPLMIPWTILGICYVAFSYSFAGFTYYFNRYLTAGLVSFWSGFVVLIALFVADSLEPAAVGIPQRRRD